nr:exonuclease 1 isoform X1 [Ipomoea batatas]
MGIQGLLPLLKSIMVPIHIKDLDGCCVAVDTYSWLHKGALSCSKELCKGLPTSKHISYCMHRVNLLRHYGVKPIMVFDGGFLPMKGEQENMRARIRKESLSRAIEHESNGNQSAAYECYQKAVDISPSVAYDLIQVLKRENVQYVVAPYEADAEMTFLAVSKQVDAIITEDSDLIAFGCPRIIYKMDKYGQGVEFQFSMLQQNKDLNFTGFTKQMVLEMCILSGCDYLQSLPGMGLKKAHALMKKFRSYDKVIKHLKYNTGAVPPLYEESFKKAIMTFQHQLVYDPVTEDLVHLSELPAGADEDIEFLGPYPCNIAKGIARGDLDPLTKMPFQKQCPGTELDYSQTNQLKNFKLEGQSKKLDLPAQKNLLTNYFCILLGIASLEAKKSFRPPRITPIDPNPEDGSPSSLLDCNAGANSCELGSSPESPPVPMNSSVLLEENHVNKLVRINYNSAVEF